MRPPPWRKNGRAWSHRLTAGIALAAYLIVAVGVPLPASGRKEHSQPFPCQDDPCGCQSAEQCWRHCCCYTPEQHWTWARERGIEPPAYATRPRSLSGAAVAQRTSPCCAGHHTTEQSHRAGDKISLRKSHWFVGLAHQRCRGSATGWVMAGAVLPLRRPRWWVAVHIPLGWLAYASECASRRPSSPLEPPPRPLGG